MSAGHSSPWMRLRRTKEPRLLVKNVVASPSIREGKEEQVTTNQSGFHRFSGIPDAAQQLFHLEGANMFFHGQFAHEGVSGYGKFGGVYVDGGGFVFS